MEIFKKKEGGVEIKHYFSEPENYIEPKTYPRYQVANVESGAGTFAPRLGGRKFYFKSREEAEIYIDSQRQQGFRGDAEITIFDDEYKGSTIANIEVK